MNHSQLNKFEVQVYNVIQKASERIERTRSVVIRRDYMQKIKIIRGLWTAVRKDLLSQKKRPEPFWASVTGPPGIGKSELLKMVSASLHKSAGMLDVMKCVNFSARDKYDSTQTTLSTCVIADDPYSRPATDEFDFGA
jgi:ABC-type uncharacterized transport system ATPase subunit